MRKSEAPRSWGSFAGKGPPPLPQQGLLGWWWESQRLRGPELLSTWTSAPGRPAVHSGHSHGGQRGRAGLGERGWIRGASEDRRKQEATGRPAVSPRSGCPEPPVHGPPHPPGPAPHPAPGSCAPAPLPSSPVPLGSSAEVCQESGPSVPERPACTPRLTVRPQPSDSPQLLRAWPEGVGQGLLLRFRGQPGGGRGGPGLQRASPRAQPPSLPSSRRVLSPDPEGVAFPNSPKPGRGRPFRAPQKQSLPLSDSVFADSYLRWSVKTLKTSGQVEAR